MAFEKAAEGTRTYAAELNGLLQQFRAFQRGHAADRGEALTRLRAASPGHERRELAQDFYAVAAREDADLGELRSGLRRLQPPLAFSRVHRRLESAIEEMLVASGERTTARRDGDREGLAAAARRMSAAVGVWQEAALELKNLGRAASVGEGVGRRARELARTLRGRGRHSPPPPAVPPVG